MPKRYWVASLDHCMKP